jgi:hypothetical protein
MAVIEVTGLSKSFGGQVALNGLNRYVPGGRLKDPPVLRWRRIRLFRISPLARQRMAPPHYMYIPPFTASTCPVM